MNYQNYLEVKPLTLTETLEHSNKDYNPQAWEREVKRYATKYKEVEFFERVNNPNEYNQLFVKYQINEGIIFFGKLSYSGSMSNGYFAMCKIEDGKLMKTEHFVNTDKETRETMAKLSKSPLKIIFTKE
jgi:hypothetical protein